MSYSYGMFESPVVDPQQGMNAAKARCAAWGYSGAEPFGGFTSQCSQPSSSGCGFAPIFPDICYHLTHYKPAAADIPVASDNPAHYADAIRYNAR
ncbi:hypothetical protein J4V29_23315, partial [Escherichia coli]